MMTPEQRRLQMKIWTHKHKGTPQHNLNNEKQLNTETQEPQL